MHYSQVSPIDKVQKQEQNAASQISTNSQSIQNPKASVQRGITLKS